MKNTKITEDEKKKRECTGSSGTSDSRPANNSPACYADSPEVREEYRLETEREKSPDEDRNGRK